MPNSDKNTEKNVYQTLENRKSEPRKMSKNLGGWIHSFAITETSTHKKGYTVYKVTSIVFPRSVPEALTCITVWKRFSEIKRLYRELFKRHKILHLRGQVPEPKEPGLFKRFDTEVIAGRKDYILHLLDFAAQHPALYKSHPFLSFFETGGNTPTTPSPLHHKTSNIENICDNLDLPFQSDIQLIDPRKDDSAVQQLSPSFVPNQEENEQIVGDEDGSQGNDDNSIECDTSSICSVLQMNSPIDNDYIYEAAYDFSRAVQAEVNQDFKEAYSKYNSGIEKLLGGSKDDTNDDRRTIAKTKVAKYVTRAQEVYENHLLYETDKNKKSLHLSIDVIDSKQEVYLERPWNQLAKFKVMQVIDTVMQVQDVTDKSVYIMKTIQKPSTNTNSHSIFLPQNVPYMANMIGFFQSESAIFLLIEHAKGGKLFDYIKTYTPTGHMTTSLSEIFSDFCQDVKLPDTNHLSPSTSPTHDSDFVELLNECKSEVYETSPTSSHLNSTEHSALNIPSFAALSQDMDVNDLVSCSQKLLESVSNTLEQFKKVSVQEKEVEVPEPIKSNAVEKPEKIEMKALFKNYMKPIKLVEFSKHVVLPEASIKQWSRELLVAIESLHSKGIVLGDLHSRNILLGSKGQLLLSYFYQSVGFNSTSQIVINPAAVEGLHVAPERPLTTKSDWWSFGVIMFELLTGYTYRSCHPGGLDCYYEIQFPQVEITETAKDLLNGILQKNPDFRYDIDRIKSHQFFKRTVWNDVRINGVC